LSALRIHILVLLTLLGRLAYGQQPTEDLEMELESIAEGSEDNEVDFTQLAERLALARENPIEVNFADQYLLNQLPWLNFFHVANLLSYRKKTGFIYSPYELQAVPGWDKALIEKTLPYLSFNTKPRQPQIKLGEIARYSRHQVIARSTRNFPLRKGFRSETENGYLGGPQDYYLRYRGRFRDLLSVGLVMQHDKGEPFATPYRSLPVDHLSGHVALRQFGAWESIILGDYQAEFGQGLAFWSGLAFGKSAQTVAVKRYGRGFRPFTGAEENRFLRGAAATYRFNENLKANAFISHQPIDANVSTEDSTGSPAFVSSLQTSGLHRTESELADRHSNPLTIYGGNLKYSGKQLAVGASAVRYQLQTPLEPSTQLYKKFEFAGRELQNLSVDYTYLLRGVQFFGEWAWSDNGAWASINGLQANPAESFFVTLTHRHFDKEYQALFNAPFSESGRNGEQGTYLGVEWGLGKRSKLNAYLDAYRFSWARFRVDQPSRGRDFFAQLEHEFSRYFSAYVRVKNERRQVNGEASSADRVADLIWQERSSIRLHSLYTPLPQWRLASRIEWALQNENGRRESGQVVFQDVRYTFNTFPLQLTGRYAIIRTDSYDTRIYAYENDLLYSFSIPPYFGRAHRFYVLADWDITERLTLQAKYAQTVFYDRETISSGLNEIEGSQIQDVRLQLRWKF